MLLFGAVVATGAVGGAAPAQAVCREVTVVGFHVITACASAEAGLDGTTAAPIVTFDCQWNPMAADDPCNDFPIEQASVGRSGFEPSPTPPAVEIDPTTLSLRIGSGTIGTLWTNGTPRAIAIDETCVGDPGWCG
jgi:hypothetical protein